MRETEAAILTQAQPAAAGQHLHSSLEQVNPASGFSSELALIAFFLAVIFTVPVAQTLLELAHYERVQFTDVFRYPPTAKNLRQYENNLKEKSWFQQNLRPEVQRALFLSLRDTGAKGVLGRDNWLFYRADLRYVIQPDSIEQGESESRWVEPATRLTHSAKVLETILRYRDQLKDRQIELIVLPVPGKPSVYPDQLVRGVQFGDYRSPTEELISRLERKGVATVNLFAAFRNYRLEHEKNGGDKRLYLARDTHWTPEGAKLAASAVADKIAALGLAPDRRKSFALQEKSVTRWGDVLEMMQIPGMRDYFSPETVSCLQVADPALGLLVPAGSERPGTFRYPGQSASVLVLGDSFSRIYQFPEPQTLGSIPNNGANGKTRETQGSKRLLPGSAGFVSLLASSLQSPIDAIYSDGGASTDVRRKLSTNPEILEGKKVIVWEFVERDIALGAIGWEDVPLPPKLN